MHGKTAARDGPEGTWAGGRRMNSTRKDTPTHKHKALNYNAWERDKTDKSESRGRRSRSRATKSRYPKYLTCVSVRSTGRGPRGGDRLELRLDKHSHYAQLTICCQAIKYLCVCTGIHPEGERESDRVQGSMEYTAMSDFMSAA